MEFSAAKIKYGCELLFGPKAYLQQKLICSRDEEEGAGK